MARKYKTAIEEIFDYYSFRLWEIDRYEEDGTFTKQEAVAARRKASRAAVNRVLEQIDLAVTEELKTRFLINKDLWDKFKDEKPRRVGDQVDFPTPMDLGPSSDA